MLGMHSKKDLLDYLIYFGGFAPVLRWDTAQNLNCKKNQAPSPIGIYNIFINRVDLMEQGLKVNVTREKKKQFLL